MVEVEEWVIYTCQCGNVVSGHAIKSAVPVLAGAVIETVTVFCTACEFLSDDLPRRYEMRRRVVTEVPR